MLGRASLPFTIRPLPAGIVAPRFTNVGPALAVAPPHPAGGDCINRMGTGAGWADYNGDGWLDLFVSDYVGGSHLYRNDLGTKGASGFTEVTASAFAGSLTHGQLVMKGAAGVTWADYSGDGRPDLLVSAVGHPYLFRNEGNSTFTHVTEASGLAGYTYRGESAAWADFNADGLLDLYLVYYAQDCFAFPIPLTLTAPDHLLMQTPSHNFVDVTGLLGGSSSPAVNGLGFQAAWLDYNNDRRPDLFVVNDFGPEVYPNVLWRNDGGTFTNVAHAARLDYAMSSMGIAVGDYNRDGNFDVAVSNIHDNAIAKGSPSGAFTYASREEGLARGWVMTKGEMRLSITWGLGFFDLDNDAYEDLFVVGGSLRSSEQVPNAVFLSNIGHHLTGLPGDGNFLDLTHIAGTEVSWGRTAAFADFDADGFVDVYLVPWYGQAFQLYRNEGTTDGNVNNWLDVRLVGADPGALGSLAHGSNRDGIGTRLTLTSASGTQYRQIMSGSSLGAGDQPAAHFGVGLDVKVKSLKIDWPSGYTQTYTDLTANQRLVVTEGAARIGTDPSRGRSLSLCDGPPH